VKVQGQIMDKIAFAKWVEGPEVRERFEIGGYATIASAVYVPNKAPTTVFIIDHIQEIHYLAPLDADTKQPRCLGVKQQQGSQVVMYPPIKLRPLNDEENKLVDLRNKEARRQAREQSRVATTVSGPSVAAAAQDDGRKPDLRTGIVGGEVVVIDNDTGEIVSYGDTDPSELRAG
jgi:hypothetical protein